MTDFTKELPVADIRLGKTSSIRVYGFADIEPRLVEVRIDHRYHEVLNLTVQQARDLAAGLLAAAARAAE